MSKKITDVWFSAYLKYRNFKLINYEVIKRGKARFEFEISSAEYKKMKIEFADSEISKIRSQIEELKNLCY